MEKSLRSLLEKIVPWRWIPIAVCAAALMLKSTILEGFITNPPCVVPDVWRALNEYIPFMRIHWCFVALVVAPAFLFNFRGHLRYLSFINLTVSIIFLFDLWYYRAFSRFTSVQHLRETPNLRNLAPAIRSFINPTDFLFLLDAVILILFVAFWKPARPFRRSIIAALLLILLPGGYLLYFNATHEIDEVYLFATRWVPIETISALSPIGYHLYDLVANSLESQQIRLTPDDRGEITAWFESNKESLPPNKYRGLFRGLNLILIQSESLENFVIGKKIKDDEITPNLNRLVNNGFYFRQFFEQVGDGTSSDAEFIANTSIYPLRTGSVAWRYPQNKYVSLPKLLEGMGYWTVDIHGDPASFWNWAQMMTGVGMKECIDAKSFVQDEIIDLGLSDGSFLKQAAPMIMKLKQPFYAYVVLETNHVPYDLPGAHRELDLDPKIEESEVGGYLQGAHYVDRQIGLFLSKLETAGLLENTVVGIFGDHCGIHKFSQAALSRVPEDEKKWMENGKRIPLILYKKGMTGELIDTIGGEVDMLPTIASLMGVNNEEFEKTAMGRNLLNTRRNFVILYDGEYVAPAKNGEEKNHALQGMELADKMIRSDYFKVK